MLSITCQGATPPAPTHCSHPLCCCRCWWRWTASWLPPGTQAGPLCLWRTKTNKKQDEDQQIILNLVGRACLPPPGIMGITGLWITPPFTEAERAAKAAFPGVAPARKVEGVGRWGMGAKFLGTQWSDTLISCSFVSSGS